MKHIILIQLCYTIKTCSQQYRNVQKRIQKIIRQTQDNTFTIYFFFTFIIINTQAID